MDKEKAVYFRDELRKAREAALADAEAFIAIVVVLERLGSYLAGKRESGLGRYKRPLSNLAATSALACQVPEAWRGCHLPFGRLFDLVCDARNTAVHEGAHARHFTEHAIQLSIVLEDALMNEAAGVAEPRVEDFMVRNPVIAMSWQPLSFIRQAMLASSFSFLPVFMSKNGPEQWWLVSDYAVASYLRRAKSKKERDTRLMRSLAEAVGPDADADKNDGLPLYEPRSFRPSDAISKVLPREDGLLVLVMDDPSSESSKLLGILSPFDLL